jgi:hypothetical protein
MDSFIGIHVTETAGVGIKEVILIIYTAHHLTVRTQGYVAETVGSHIAAVAHCGLESTEVVAVIATQTVPRGKPQETLSVLKELCDMAMRQSVLLVVEGNGILLLTYSHHPTSKQY